MPSSQHICYGRTSSLTGLDTKQGLHEEVRGSPEKAVDEMCVCGRGGGVWGHKALLEGKVRGRGPLGLNGTCLDYDRNLTGDVHSCYPGSLRYSSSTSGLKAC